MRDFWLKTSPLTGSMPNISGGSSVSRNRCSIHGEFSPQSYADISQTPEYNLQNFFWEGWRKSLESATSGIFNLWSSLPLEGDVLDFSKEPLGESYVWEGWGTSLCWWAHFAGGLSQTDMDFVVDLMFDTERGLGFNIARYNIGGGADKAFDTNLRAFADIPGFKPSASEGYDWSADEKQRKILLGAKSRGANKFEAFSNSPPPWMTKSGSVTGDWKRGQDNLDPSYYDAFADYLTEVVRHYETHWGVHFDYLAPFNEPVEGFWNINRKRPAQEGCNFSIEAINKVLAKVKKSLEEKQLSTELSGVDAWSLNTARVLRGLDEQSLGHVKQVNVHTYIPFVQREGDARRREVQRVVAKGKKIWVSEYGPLHWRGSEVNIALAVAKHITLDINELQASAWCYWQVLEVPGRNLYWGLVHAHFDYKLSFTVELKKQYYVMMQFSRWVRPGFLILPVQRVWTASTLIALEPTAMATLVLVHTNSSGRIRKLSFDVGQLGYKFQDQLLQVAMFRTSETENHEQLASLYSRLSTLTIPVAPKSVTTIIVSNAK